MLLEAMQLLTSEISTTRVTLTIAGADFYGSSYGEKLHDRAVAEFITLIGYVSYGASLFELYDSHDVLVLSSFTEGFPQVIFEAMARGLPIVATTAGGIPRIIQNRHNGLLVAPGDATALVKAISELAADQELYNRLSFEGLSCVKSHMRQTEIRSMRTFIEACYPNLVIAKT